MMLLVLPTLIDTAIAGKSRAERRRISGKVQTLQNES